MSPWIRMKFIVCIWLLLLVTPSLAQSGDGDDDEDSAGERTAYACEFGTLTLDCPESRVIRIVRANYGRFSAKMCNPHGITSAMLNLRCQSVRSREIVASKCDGHRECQFQVNNQLFGDPCPGTSKYAEVKFYCEYAENEVPPVSTTKRSIPDAPLPPWQYRTVPTPQDVRVCHHPQSKGSMYDIFWNMPETHFDIIHFKFSLKCRIASGREEIEKEIYANYLGDGNYAFSWKPDLPDIDYEFAIRALSASYGSGEYSHYVSSKVCDGELPLIESPKTVVQTAPAQQMCPALVMHGVAWPKSRPEEVRSALCPQELGKGMMLFKCLKNGSWDPNGPEKDDCHTYRHDKEETASSSSTSTTTTSTTTTSTTTTSPQVPVDPQEAERNVETLERRANHMLMNLTTHGRGNRRLHSSEVIKIASLLPGLTQNMSSEIESVKDLKQKKARANKFKESILSIGDELLHDHVAWNNMSVREQRSTAASLLASMETTGLLVASTMDTGASNVTRRMNLVMKLLNVDLQFDQNATLVEESSGSHTRNNQFTISVSTLRRLANKQTRSMPVAFVVFTNMSEWLTPMNNLSQGQGNTNTAYISDTPGQEPPRRIVNSDIISASVCKHRVRNLAEPVVFMLEHGQIEAVANPRCSFWDTRTNAWSSEGCYIQSTNKTHTTCECYHLTSFAVLMDITGATMLMPASTRFSLELITYIGCTISIICLMLSWATFTCFKSLECDRNTIHKHLVFCLMVAQIVLVIGIQQTQIKVLCSIIAGALHFLFLAAFAWMCLEGVQLYAMLIEVFESERSRVLWYYLFGYGVPTVIVAISAGIYSQGYGTDMHCWLSTERGFIWSFVGPALGVMLVNAVMLIMAIYIMIRHSGMSHTMRQKSVPQKMRTWIKGAVVLVVLLGLTWVFGVLYLDSNTLIFCYLFTILNSLQGLFIFLFHCLLNEKVQKEYRRLVRHSHWLPDCIRVGYGGASSSGSREPSSSGNMMSRFLRGRKKLSNADSTSNSAQPFLKKEQRRISSSVPSSSDGATSSRLSSDTSNNNHRKSSRLSTQHSSAGNTRFLKPPEMNGINADLSQVLDCSIVDSEFVTEYCQQNLQVSAEVKRYSTASEDSGRGRGVADDAEEERDRLAALSFESLSKQQPAFISSSDFGDGERSDGGGRDNQSEGENVDGSDIETGEEREHPGRSYQQHCPAETRPLMKQTDSERVLINNAVNKPRPLDQPSPRHSPSLKHVNTGADQGQGTGSTPNLKFKPGINKPVADASSSPEKEAVMNSLPNLTVPSCNGTPVSVEGCGHPDGTAHSPGVKRHLSDGHVYFSPFRFSASEC